ELPEDDAPLRGRGDEPERPEERESRRHGDVRETEQLRDEFVAVEHGARFFRPDDRAGDERRVRAEREADEPAAAEALQLVPIAIELADPLHALGENGDEALLAEEAFRVLLTRAHAADAAHERADERQVIDVVLREPAELAPARVLAPDGRAEHEPV